MFTKVVTLIDVLEDRVEIAMWSLATETPLK